jgi:hypothetical protein
MCTSTHHDSDPVAPAAPVIAPVLELDKVSQERTSAKNKQRLGTKTLQIPLTSNTQSGLAIPNKNNG